jgi:Na+-translocating ferredoxin:NAD+ oxidoreductase RnfG subunit
MKKFYLITIIAILLLIGTLFYFNNSVTGEEMRVKNFYPNAKKIELIKDISDDLTITLNFPALKRAYEVDGIIKAYVVSCVGYNGPIELLAAFDSDSDTLIGIDILSHEESLDYAEHIEKDWFLDRFKDLLSDTYLNLVPLDKESPEDIISVTGATVSSQAVVNAVNAAIGAYQYKSNNNIMASVPDVVPQEMWQKDMNSFAINWKDSSIRIDTDEIKEYEQIEVEAVLINTTGTETDLELKGPTLRHVLQTEGIDLNEYAGIGITGRDGYYTMVDKEKLELNEVILAWQVDGRPIKDDEKPVRVGIPNELGPYWVKMVSNIDLYKEISPKDIDKVHMFEALTRDIEPYYYEYYGSKDKSIEVGKILRKFEEVDEKGFFTMGASDGLIKNETISLVRQRYFIKVEGDNAPMNIAPGFKLGMNVKHMTHFSTTKDAVIFPELMKDVVRTKDIDGKEALLLEDVLLTAGMRWTDNSTFSVANTNNDEFLLSIRADEIPNLYIIYDNGQVTLHDGNNIMMNDLLRIVKK